MPSDTDLLRAVLPRLHAKGIAARLHEAPLSPGSFILIGEDADRRYDCALRHADAITYAIGAMVEHALLQGRSLNLGFVEPPSPLRDVIECMEILALIDPPTTEEE